MQILPLMIENKEEEKGKQGTPSLSQRLEMAMEMRFELVFKEKLPIYKKVHFV